MTTITKQDLLKFLKSIAGIADRIGGSEKEREAAGVISDTLSSFGLEPILETFEVYTYKIEHKSLLTGGKKPFMKVPCEGIGFSADTPENGLEGNIEFLDLDDISKYHTAEDRIVFAYNRLNIERYKLLMRHDPLGIVRCDTSPGKPAPRTELLHEWLQYGSVPMLYISFEDALKILKRKHRKAKMYLRQTIFSSISANVICDVEGTDYPDEMIVICGHYDSIPGGYGALDNASGVALTLSLAKMLSVEVPKRSVRLIFFGSEELGLRGSIAYSEKHKDELDKHVLVVNLDVHGSMLGALSFSVLGSDTLTNYVSSYLKECGFDIEVSNNVVSTDSSTFSLKGVPSISISRGGGTSAYLHTDLDTVSNVSTDILLKDLKLIYNLILRIANAERIPFERKVPSAHIEKARKYFEERYGPDFTKKLLEEE